MDVRQKAVVQLTPQQYSERIKAHSQGSDRSVVKLVNSLVQDALARGASDLHIDPTPQGLMVRLRIDGLLEHAHILPGTIHDELIARLKILSGLRTDEHFLPQDGRFRLDYSKGTSVDIRIAIIPTYYGENAVLRLLSQSSDALTFSSLGVPAYGERLITRTLSKSQGMILVTGPTGSGKTTTLYTLMRMLSKLPLSLVTIEDPIEYSLSGVSQIQVRARGGLTFAQGLRSLLRQDPDVLMVGEIRDVETAGLAINAALTGHLVLSTLHTNSAAATLPRLLDMQVEPYLIASTVSLVVAQRLVRRICSNCIIRNEITSEEHAELAFQFPKDSLMPSSYSQGAGCRECSDVGYRGRVGVFEVLKVTPAIQDAIAARARSSELEMLAIQSGMQLLHSDGLAKVDSGQTTMEEILRLRHE